MYVFSFSLYHHTQTYGSVLELMSGAMAEASRRIEMGVEGGDDEGS